MIWLLRGHNWFLSGKNETECSLFYSTESHYEGYRKFEINRHRY